MKILVFDVFKEGQIFKPFSDLKFNFFQKLLMVVYVHIQYSTYQFSGESKGGGRRIPTSPPGPYGTEKSVVLRGLIKWHDFLSGDLT